MLADEVNYTGDFEGGVSVRARQGLRDAGEGKEFKLVAGEIACLPSPISGILVGGARRNWQEKVKPCRYRETPELRIGKRKSSECLYVTGGSCCGGYG